MKRISAAFVFIILAISANGQSQAQEYLNLGQQEYEHGDFMSAIEDFDKAVALTHSELAFYGRGHCKYYVHNYFGAVEDMDSVLMINPNNASALRCRGAAKRLMKLYNEALDDLNKSIRINPNDTAYINRGWVKLALKDSVGALADFNTVVSLGATSYHFIQRARIRTFLKDYTGAFADYDSAMAANGDGIPYTMDMAKAWTQMEKKDYSSAIDIYTVYLKLFYRAELYINRGNAEANLGLDGLALKDYHKAIKAEPHKSDGYSAIGEFRFKEGSYLKSIIAYNKAIKINPKNAELYFMRGSAKQKLERHGPAIQDFSMAISLNPNYAIALRCRGDAEKAVDWLKPAAADYFKATQLGCAKEEEVLVKP